MNQKTRLRKKFLYVASFSLKEDKNCCRIKNISLIIREVKLNNTVTDCFKLPMCALKKMVVNKHLGYSVKLRYLDRIRKKVLPLLFMHVYANMQIKFT